MDTEETIPPADQSISRAERRSISRRLHDSECLRAAEWSNIHARLNRGSERMGVLEKMISENTLLTKEIKEILDMGKSFFRLAGYMGKVAKWVGAIALAVGAVFAAIKGVREL